ncbi:alpha,alpha-trehalase TreF [Cupriavidus sp. 2TAF22]|uniref:alpha,alpha-trehalase TreF n=1 Tax=unclassified Cupriavidus TaxID=2640874 RepID=UPI003F928270
MKDLPRVAACQPPGPEAGSPHPGPVREVGDRSGGHHVSPHRLPGCAHADPLTPADRYQELFVAVQMARVFSDSKTFTDAIPRQDPESILTAYRASAGAAGFDLAGFVQAHFTLQEVPRSRYVSDPHQTLGDHIDALWPVLTRHPAEHPPQCSLLPLPNAYVVPGGRFTELYYWDSYFTMLGLTVSGDASLLHGMADNFSYLLDTYGVIPNGTRTYYLSRSQPPVFALMVELFDDHGVKPELAYLPQLRKEYAFWMRGAEHLAPGQACRRVVRLADGSLLNRYWDERDTPREEAFIEDIGTAAASSRPAPEVYRDLRAAAESGWDFSSRWQEPGGGLETIRTTAILPVDLNSLLYKLETKLAELAAAAGEADAPDFLARVQARRHAIDHLMWNEAEGAWFDFDWQRHQPRANLTAATVMPLYVDAASPAQAARLARTVTARLLQPGGMATTERISGEQWDQPNGWAPLQWLAIGGFARHGQRALAREIAHRWLHTVASLYRREYKLVEKYALRHAPHGAVGGGGGEYLLQDGFGWTNGVVRRLLQQHPSHAACASRAGEPG